MIRPALAIVLASALALTGCANSQKDSDKKVETAVSVENKAPKATPTSSATPTETATPTATATPTP